VVGRIEAVPTETEPSSTASTQVRVPQPAPPSEPEPSRARAPASESASRPLAPAPTIAPNTNAPIATVLSPAEVDGLLKHGKELFAIGDIAGARALFLRAAAGNDPSALTALAQTYDPQVLRTMRVRGVKPDPSKAKAYYEQAEAAQKRR
jgi:TPR repeat protein